MKNVKPKTIEEMTSHGESVKRSLYVLSLFASVISNAMAQNISVKLDPSILVSNLIAVTAGFLGATIGMSFVQSRAEKKEQIIPYENGHNARLYKYRMQTATAMFAGTALATFVTSEVKLNLTQSNNAREEAMKSTKRASANQNAQTFQQSLLPQPVKSVGYKVKPGESLAIAPRPSL